MKGKSYEEYVLLKHDVLSNIITGTVDIERCKQFVKNQFGNEVMSRRKLSRIKTIQDLLKEFEKRLIIFPDKTGIKPFLKLVEFINSQHAELIKPRTLQNVRNLTSRLQPRLAPAPTPAAPAVTLISREKKEKLITELTRPEACQDWRHFLLGLGHDLPEEQRIKLRMGDIDRLENSCPSLYVVMRKCLDVFERNCQINNMTIDVLQHAVDVLSNRNIMGEPYKR